MAGGPKSGGGGDAVVIKTNLRQVLADLKEFDPKLATGVRRQLRQSGDDAIKAMGDILDAYQPSARAPGLRAPRRPPGSAREDIKRGLAVRVSTGKRSSTVRLVAPTGDLRKALNKKAWRHPVFGTAAWVEQPGSRYFTRGTLEQLTAMRAALESAISVAVEATATHNTTTE